MSFKMKFEEIWRINEQYIKAYRNHKASPYTKCMKGHNEKQKIGIGKGNQIWIYLMTQSKRAEKRQAKQEVFN